MWCAPRLAVVSLIVHWGLAVAIPSGSMCVCQAGSTQRATVLMLRPDSPAARVLGRAKADYVTSERINA